MWKEWKEALGGRAVSKEEEEDLLGAFFYRVYEFLFSFSNPPPIIHRPSVPDPARYVINFVSRHRDDGRRATLDSTSASTTTTRSAGPQAVAATGQFANKLVQ